jgi:hypothetical protein
MITEIATTGQVRQLVTALTTFLKGDGVRGAFRKAGFTQFLNSKFRIRACFRSMAAVLATYANAENPWARDLKEKQSAKYPKEYRQVPLARQLELIQLKYPGICCSEAYLNMVRDLPTGYEGFGMLPKPSALIRERRDEGLTDAYGEGESGADYGKLLEAAFDMLAGQYPSTQNFRAGALGPKQVWLDDRVSGILQEMEQANPGEDVFIFPINLGDAYAGTTPRYACEDILLADGLPLPALFVTWLLYVNPERFINDCDLWIDCVADRYREKSSEDVTCLGFDRSNGTVSFRALKLNDAGGNGGAASASLSEAA